MENLLRGATDYLKGLKVIAQHGLWVYFWIPVLLSLLLGGIVISGAWAASDNLGDWLISFYPFEWGRVAFEKMATLLSGLSIVVFTLLIFRYIIMAIAAPFMSLLSEKMEHKMYPGTPAVTFSFSKMASDLARGIALALRNIVRELFLTIVLLLLTVILPILSPVTPILILLIQAYYAGFGNFDFTLERHANMQQSVRFVRGNRMLAVGNGLVFVLLLMTVVGFLFALPLGTAAGTVSTLERLDEAA
ncbi:MAG: EI24 domain-containing protein [Saprospiraceae bacterium]